METQHTSPFQFEAVSSTRQLDEFIAVPWSDYRNDPCWVPPLKFEQKQRLTARNPYFEHACWQAWTARRDGHIIGRISAQIDQLHQQQHGDYTGHFGMLEGEDDPALFAALLQTAEDWLREQGMRRICGPFNLSINEECGLLTQGFDTPPYIMMGHARPYYAGHVEAAGYTPATDLLAYTVAPDFEPPAVMTRLVRAVGADITIRSMRRKQMGQELEILRDLFNDAWSKNWSFVPFTQAEFADIGELLKVLINDDFVRIAEIRGRPVAMIVALPNINEAIRDLDGKLLPFGWLKLLWRLKVRYPRTARTSLMGVRKEFQQTRLGAALAFMVIDAVRKSLKERGIHTVELSWILEGNTGMRSLLEVCGATISKRYRLYEKPL